MKKETSVIGQAFTGEIVNIYSSWVKLLSWQLQDHWQVVREASILSVILKLPHIDLHVQQNKYIDLQTT